MAISVVNDYYGKVIGGAERSLEEILSNKKVEVITSNRKTSIRSNLEFTFIGMPPLRYFPYLTYTVNSLFLKQKKIYRNKVYAYGISGVKCLYVQANSEKVFYVRSISDLGLAYFNSHAGNSFFRLFSRMKKFLEWPFFILWKRDLVRVLSTCRVVANSNFIAKKVLEEYHINAFVKYPIQPIPIDNYKLVRESTVFGMIGAEQGKGFEILKKLSRHYVSLKFVVLDRTLKSERKVDNIFYFPFSDDIAYFWRDIDALLVPSQWQEAFGRVAVEAVLNDVVPIVSNVGGLPEAVCFNDDLIVSDYKSHHGWIELLENKLFV